MSASQKKIHILLLPIVEARKKKVISFFIGVMVSHALNKTVMNDEKGSETHDDTEVHK